MRKKTSPVPTAHALVNRPRAKPKGATLATAKAVTATATTMADHKVGGLPSGTPQSAKKVPPWLQT